MKKVGEQPKATVCLPYVHRDSDALKRVLESFCFRTVIKLHQTLMQKLLHPKDVIPEMVQTDMGNAFPVEVVLVLM